MNVFAFAEGGAQIFPDGSLVFALILFLLFVFILNRILFRPIGRVLDQRESLTDGARAEARAAVGQYGARLSEYESAIKQARTDGYRNLEQERTLRLAERQQAIEAAKQEASARIESGKAELAEQTAAARAELQSEATRLAAHISSTVLGRTVGGGAD